MAPIYYVLLLFGVIVIQQILHHYERRDLYNRIMSKNLTEYKGLNNDDPPPYPVSAHKKVLNRWRDKRGGEDQ